MIKPWRQILTLALLVTALSAQATDLAVVYNKSEQKFFMGLLQEALEHTKSDGAYTLKPTDTVVGATRQMDDIAENTGTINIMTRGSNSEDEKKLLPIRIPLDKGLLGYRVPIVRKQDLPKFAAIQSVEELKQLRTGQGTRWPDAKILAKAGFSMSNGTFSPGLLRMLNEKRFDMLPRATWEIEASLKEAEAQGLNDLVLEPTLAIYYPNPRIFMVSRKGNGPALAARVEKGLRAMIKDGSFDKAFNEFFGPALKSTNLRGRRIFRVDNALLSPETPLNDKSLWFLVETNPTPAKK
jgi:ABC-type amino acid transport substrate-binding protein